MLYIYMLGYDVDFGHMEAVSLISAPKYPEKQVSIILHVNLSQWALAQDFLFLKVWIEGSKTHWVYM